MISSTRIEVFRKESNGAQDFSTIQYISICSRPGIYATLKKLRFSLDSDLYLPFLVFADNVYIIAHSIDDAARIFSHVQRSLHRGGWRLPLEEAEWITNQADPDISWPAYLLPDQGPPKRREEIRALGVNLNARGYTYGDTNKKLFAVTSAIDDRQVLWKTRASTRVQRCTLLQRLSQPILSWSAPVWTLTVRDIAQIRTQRRRAVGGIVREPKLANEGGERYHRRRNRVITAYMRGSGFIAWEVFVLRLLFTWAGHVARMRRDEPNRLTSRVLAYKSCNELEAFAFLSHGWQGHPGRFYVPGWERQFYTYFRQQCLDWQDVAQNRRTWNGFFCEWAKDRMKSKSLSNLEHIISSSKRKSDQSYDKSSKRRCLHSVL